MAGKDERPKAVANHQEPPSIASDSEAHLRVLGCQISIPEGITTSVERDAHVSRLIALIDSRLQGMLMTNTPLPHLVVLPELTTVTYGDSTFANLDSLAEVVDAGVAPDDVSCPSAVQFARLAQKYHCHVSFGMPRKVRHFDAPRSPTDCASTVKKELPSAMFHVCQVMLDPEGQVLSVYNKLHLAHFGDCKEKNFFTLPPKAAPQPIAEICGFRVGTVICYDFRFPELCRHLAFKENCDLILHPAAFPKDAASPSREAFVITRAMENQVYFLSLNRAGAHYGDTLFCPPCISNDLTLCKVEGGDEALELFIVSKRILQETRDSFPFRRDVRNDY